MSVVASAGERCRVQPLRTDAFTSPRQAGTVVVAPPATVNALRPLQMGGLGRDKVLICHFFERAYAIAAAEAAGRVATAPRRSTSDETSSNSSNPQTPNKPNEHGGQDHGNFICALFPLTPRGKEPERFSQRSGRPLNESESLQVKHADEYQFLLPTLTYALQHAISAHEEIWQQERKREAESRSPKSSTTTTEEDEDGDDSQLCPSTFQPFITPDVPPVTVLDYLKRIVKYTYASPSALLVACLYLDRLLTRWDSLLLHPQVAFKLIITAVRISSKVLDTRTLNNKDFALVGGITNGELNELELHFIINIDYDVYVCAEEFNEYAHHLIAAAAGKAPKVAPPATLTTPVAAAPPSVVRSLPTFTMRGNRRGSIAAVLPSGRRRSYSIVAQSGIGPNLRAASRPAPPMESSCMRENSMVRDSSYAAFLDEEAALDAAGAAGAAAADGPRHGGGTSPDPPPARSPPFSRARSDSLEAGRALLSGKAAAQPPPPHHQQQQQQPTQPISRRRPSLIAATRGTRVVTGVNSSLPPVVATRRSTH